MPSPRDELTIGEWAVLALLSEAPTHGFAIARTMAPDGDVGRIWAIQRPLVYRALETLDRMELVHPIGQLPSRSGPQRTVLEATAIGQQAVAQWLHQPVEHVRDGRSLLMLKLLFLTRLDADLRPLLEAQRQRFTLLAENLTAAAGRAAGFDRTLLLWRLESTRAARQFAEMMLAKGALRPRVERSA